MFLSLSFSFSPFSLSLGKINIMFQLHPGAASLHSGQLELMLHRRLLVDDWRGVGEALNETVCGCSNCDCPGMLTYSIDCF